MNSGINAIRGYLFQYLICILDSLKDDWISVIIEPYTDAEKVDILWFYRSLDNKIYSKAVQVKSKTNQFGKPEIERLAQTLKDKFKNANEYEIVLIGQASSTLIKDLNVIQQNEEVKIPYPKVFDLEAFTGHICHKLDKYLDENYATQLLWRSRENLVFSLVGELQYYSTNKIEVTRAEFESNLQHWIKSYVNYTDYELHDSEEFRRLCGFDASPNLRMAIRKFYKQSRKVRRSFFKECQNFLTTNINNKDILEVIYPKTEMAEFYFGMSMQIVVFILFVCSTIIMVYFHWVGIILLLFSLWLLIAFAPIARPYCLAKIIDKELKELYLRR